MDVFDRKIQDVQARAAALRQCVGGGSLAEGDVVLSLFEELHTALEALRVAEEEMRQQNEELAAAREALEAERWRYVDLFQSAPDAYLVTTVEGTIQEANQAAVALLQTAPRFLIRKPLVTFIAPGDRQTFRSELQRLRTEERIADWEVFLQPRRGEPFAAALTVAAVRDREGEVTALRWLARDVSERRKAEAERYRLMVEEITDYAIFLMDPQRRVVSWNRGAESIFGHAAAEMIGQFGDIVFTPEDRERGVPEQEMRKAAADGRAEDERWHLRKDGSRFYASGVLTALRDGGGRIRWYAKVLRDLTERKGFEVEREGTLRKLQMAREGLEARVAERTIELSKANAKLEREMRERRRAEEARQDLLRELVTTQEEERRRISRELHDQMGQHLTAFTLGLRALRDASPSGTFPAHLLQRLEELAGELGREVHQLSVRLRPTALDDLGLYAALKSYVEEWSERSQVAVDFHGIGRVTDRLPSHVETTVYRVVQEALTNVVKHAGARRVSVIIERHADHVRAIVEDDGAGFDAEAVMDSADARRRLGLLGMRERAVLIGGAFTIESSPGEGTTVFLRLPLPPAEPGGEMAGASGEDHDGEPE